MKVKLTELQRDVVGALRVAGCEWVAESVAQAWRAGREAYIDSRVKCPRAVRRAFDRANREG